MVGHQLSASDLVESESVSLSPWASRFTPEPQLPHPQMGHVDPQGSCHWEWVTKSFLPPSLCLSLYYWQKALAGAVGSWIQFFPAAHLLPAPGLPLTHSQQAACFLEVQTLPPSLRSALG